MPDPSVPLRPVFVKRGDALAEVEAVLRELGVRPEEGGLHRSFFVTKADQTVVTTTTEGAPLARALRSRPGWTEPREE